MKKLLFVAVAIFCLVQLSALEMSGQDMYANKSLLDRTLPDSVYQLVKGRPALLYSYGHHGYTWVVITPKDSSYQVYSGKVRSARDFSRIYEPMGGNQIDTATLFSKKRDLFDWAFGKMHSDLSNKKRIKGQFYATFYHRLSVIDSTGRTMFTQDAWDTYSGPDSKRFNKKMGKVMFIMLWLAMPELRDCIPESKVFENDR